MVNKQDGVQVILGSSDYPRSDVLLTFISKKGSKIFISGTTDSYGQFTLIVPGALRDGTYSVTAVIVLTDGSHSAGSNTVTLRIRSVLGRELFMYLLINFGSILLIFALYFIYRRYFCRKGNTRLKNIIHKSFNILREDAATLSKEKFDELSEDLNDAENLIKKEIDE